MESNGFLWNLYDFNGIWKISMESIWFICNHYILMESFRLHRIAKIVMASAEFLWNQLDLHGIIDVHGIVKILMESQDFNVNLMICMESAWISWKHDFEMFFKMLSLNLQDLHTMQIFKIFTKSGWIECNRWDFYGIYMDCNGMNLISIESIRQSWNRKTVKTIIRISLNLQDFNQMKCMLI